jgi:hypothetical protein
LVRISALLIMIIDVVVMIFRLGLFLFFINLVWGRMPTEAALGGILCLRWRSLLGKLREGVTHPCPGGIIVLVIGQIAQCRVEVRMAQVAHDRPGGETVFVQH